MKPVTCFAVIAVALLLTLPAPTRAATSVAPAPLPPDPQGAVATLPPATPHWIYVNDFVFPHMPDGQVLLVDGDDGRFLGLLSTGFGYGRIVPAKDGKVLYSPETYFSRGTRGTRTDIVTLYDPRHLAPVGEIEIPPKRSSNMPMMGDAELTDDGRFLLIYNFTPAQSLTVVDTRTRKFVGEIETAGCALVYPTGPRSFFSICSDGALLRTTLDDAGHAKSSVRTERMFDVARDPATEKGVRVGNTWYFVTYGGALYPIDIKPDGQLALGAKWSLLSAEDSAQQWRPGGLQQLAAHPGLNRLYSIMHRGGPETHKDPGKEVWVYDLAKHTRIQKITLQNESASIQVSRDAKPLLFSVFIGSTTLDVYDAVSGAWLRSVQNVGTTPTVLVNP